MTTVKERPLKTSGFLEVKQLNTHISDAFKSLRRSREKEYLCKKEVAIEEAVTSLRLAQALYQEASDLAEHASWKITQGYVSTVNPSEDERRVHELNDISIQALDDAFRIGEIAHRVKFGNLVGRVSEVSK